jgi:hypothetical protein
MRAAAADGCSTVRLRHGMTRASTTEHERRYDASVCGTMYGASHPLAIDGHLFPLPISERMDLRA